MKKKLRNTLLICGLILSFQGANAQNKALWDNLSLEGQYGMNTALSPKEGLNTGDYSGFNFFQFGINYHIDDIWGVRGTYANSKFSHKDLDNSGVKYSRLMLEATYNILTAINLGPQDFDITAHAGLGLGSGKSEYKSGTDMVGVAQIGIMPKYNFSRRIAVFADGTFVNQFSQDFGFNGVGIKQGSGSYLNVGLGVQVRLGN